MKKGILLASACFMALALSTTAANADEMVAFEHRIHTPYFSLNGGVNDLDDTEFNFATGVDVDNEYDSGEVINAELGYNYGPFYFVDNVRLGVEVGYSENDIDSHSIGGADQASSTGDLSALSVLANMYHEFDTQTRFVPYYGLGVGFASIDAENYGVATAPDALEDDDTAFLYQVNVGLDYMLTKQFDMGLRYRYAATDGAEWTGSGAGAEARDLDFQSSNYLVNVTYRF